MTIDASPYANSAFADADELYGRQSNRDCRFTGKQLRPHVGTFTCNGSTPVTVADANFTAITSVVLISLNTVGGTVGAIPAVKTVTAGTGFTVAGTASDTSIYNYMIFN